MVPAAGVGGGTDAFAATGLPIVLAGTNTFDNHGGTIVRGFVTPDGSQVSTCQFDYGPSETYGKTAACEREPGSGSEPVEVTMDAQGLKPGATYHFRVIAINGSGTAESEDGVFVEPAEEPHQSCPNAGMPGVSVLSDCRAWEMVSSNEKLGADVSPDTSRVRVANDGSAASFYSLVGFGDAMGGAVSFEYMGVRSENSAPGNQGWVTHAILPRQDSMSLEQIIGTDTETRYDDVEGFSSDFNKAVLIATRPVTEDPMVKNLLGNLYVREDLRTPGPGNYRLVTACPVCTSPLPEEPIPVTRFAGATPDYSHVVFESKENLTEGASGAGLKVYEWHDGAVSLVSKAPDGSTFAEAGAGSGAAGRGIPPRHTISEDGSKIFFQNQTGGARVENLYMRENGTTTVQLNVSERTPVVGPARAIYAAASKDGSRVFFSSTEPLTSDAPTEGTKLYMYNTTLPPGDHNLTLIASGVEATEGPGDVIGSSDDGSYVYFAASAPVPGGPVSPYGFLAVYVWHEGSVSFVGLVRFASRNAAPPFFVSVGGSLIYQASAAGKEAVASGFTEQCSSSCAEIFSYQPRTRQLECASCSESASALEGEASYGVSRLVGGTQINQHKNASLTSDGKYAFFSSPVALVPSDTNGTYDAYVYDMETGRVSLLSSGESPVGSYFMEVTPSGHDAFFTTTDRLVGWDTDNNYDLYDARIDGGFPEPPLPPPGCEGDACQPAPVSFDDTTPASAVFSGSGNLKPVSEKPKTVSGKVKRHKSHRKARKPKHHRRAAEMKARGGQ
jgi:hypothetical protein